MADPKHVEILKKGVEAWNKWRKENNRIFPDLSGLHLHDADLSGADLKLTYPGNTDLSGANLRRTDLRGAYLRANLRRADLSGADLSDADFIFAKLGRAKLSGAKFHDAKFRFANLRHAHLFQADLSSADFSRADLTSANLGHASFVGTDLSGADLTRSDLVRADLADSTMGATLLNDLDLSETLGLRKVEHRGASSIGADTLRKSAGMIPKVFLKGCGLTDWQIAGAKLENRSLTSEQVIDLTYEIARIKTESPIQINPIFISYARVDSAFVDALEPLLDKKRIRYWRDVHNLKAGRLTTQIDRAIRQNPTVLIVLSEESAESDWVEWEVSKARELERQYRKEGKPRDVLCPIALDDSWKDCGWEEPLRRQVEKYNILDFSKWKNKREMAMAFQKLVDGLGLFYVEG